MIVADASWVIALRDPQDAHHDAARSRSDALADDDVVLLHPVTLAECLVGPAVLGVLDRAAADLRAAFDVADFDADAPERWAQLRADARLRLPDAVVLDTAIVHRATELATFDDRLRDAARKFGITS